MNMDTSRIATNKLIILYILKEVDIPLTKAQINDIVLENNLINYFTLQQCITELEEYELIKKADNVKKNIYIPTEGGLTTLKIFFDRIPKNVVSTVKDYIEKNKENIRKEAQIIADYTKQGEKEYIVNLKVIENDIILIDLKLSVVSSKQAKFICEKWTNSSQKIYKHIMETLIN